MSTCNNNLRLVIDLDERGSFRAHVADEDDKVVWEISNEDEDGGDDPDGLWLVYDGFIKHSRDVDGLLKYMQSMGFADASATLVLKD